LAKAAEKIERLYVLRSIGMLHVKLVEIYYFSSKLEVQVHVVLYRVARDMDIERLYAVPFMQGDLRPANSSRFG